MTLTELSAGDTFLVLASDGLWDVMSNDDAVGLVLDTGAPCCVRHCLCMCPWHACDAHVHRLSCFKSAAM